MRPQSRTLASTIPSLYIAVCERSDGTPRPRRRGCLRDEIVRRGKVYYAKLARGKATFIAPRIIPFFHVIRALTDSSASRLRAVVPICALCMSDSAFSDVLVFNNRGAGYRARVDVAPARARTKLDPAFARRCRRGDLPSARWCQE